MQQVPKHARRLHIVLAAPFDLHGEVAEVGHAAAAAAAGRRWRAHSCPCAVDPWARSRRDRRAVCPSRRRAPRAYSCASSLRAGADGRASRATRSSGTWCARQVFSTGLPSTNFGPRPALRRAHNQHGPCGPLGRAFFARGLLDRGDAVEDRIEDRRGLLMHSLRIVALQREWLIAVAAHQVFELRMRNAREHRRVGDLVSVQMQNRQHCAIRRGIEKFVRVPACGQRSGLGFAIAHHAGHNEVWIVEGRAIRVHQRVAQLAAFMNRSRRLRRDVAGNAVRPAELAEEPLDAVGIAARCADRSPCTSLRDRCSPPGPGRHAPDR